MPVSGNWRLTFCFENVDTVLVDYQDYHQENIMRMEGETVWLNLQQIAELFSRDKSVISRHLRNIFASDELNREATVAKNATVQLEGGRAVQFTKRRK